LAAAAAIALPLIFSSKPAEAARRKKVATCAPEDAWSATLSSVNERLELVLADGKILKVAGLDPPGPTPDDPDLDLSNGQKATAWLAGREILYRPLSSRLDRWGRIPALAFLAKEKQKAPVSVGETLIEAGLARFIAQPGTTPCRSALLEAEARARNGRLGLWADPYYAVLSADDRNSFDEKAATNIIVEGEVQAISEGPFRTNLYFGPRRGYDFSITILPRNIALFEAAGLKPSELNGKKLRVRGLLDLRFGPQIEVSSPDEVEFIATEPAKLGLGKDLSLPNDVRPLR
jgi:hypothetical protein